MIHFVTEDLDHNLAVWNSSQHQLPTSTVNSYTQIHETSCYTKSQQYKHYNQNTQHKECQRDCKEHLVECPQYGCSIMHCTLYY